MGKLEVDQDLIRELAALLEETGLGEIEIADEEHRLRIARPAVAGQAPAPPAAAAATAPPPPQDGDENLAEHPGAVTSPMVGTAYLGADPNSTPFIRVGDRVAKGQTVLIIEAMKHFNEIPAPRDGTVTRVVVENGSPVEFGEILLLLE